MDILTSKSKRDYAYTSRYSSLYYYFNTDDEKYVYEVAKNLNASTKAMRHTIVEGDTLDSLALRYFGRPDLFWVIADYNRIRDPYINLYEHYNFLYIPDLSSIRYK